MIYHDESLKLLVWMHSKKIRFLPAFEFAVHINILNPNLNKDNERIRKK